MHLLIFLLDPSISSKQLNTKVYGISGDSEKKHSNFSNKHSLNFDLLVDEDYQLSEKVGVYQLKKSFGKESYQR